MYAITLDPRLESEIQSSINQGPGGGIMSLSPERAVYITDCIKEVFDNACLQVDDPIVLLASPLIRLHLYRMIERKIDELPVLSYSEISDDIPLQILGTVAEQQLEGNVA